MTPDELQDDALVPPDPVETSTEINDPGAGFAPGEDEDLAGVQANVLPPTALEKEVLAALEQSKVNFLSDPAEREQGLSALRMVYEAKAQQRAYWQKAAEAKRRLTQAQARPIPERPAGTVGQPNSAIERMLGRKHDKRIKRAQRQLERAQEQAKLWGKTAYEAASQLNTPDAPKPAEKPPRGKPTVGKVSVKEEEALGAPTVQRIEGNKSRIATADDIAAGNIANDPKKRLAPEKFTGVEHLYTHPESMMTEWTTALQEALGPNRQMQMNRRTFFHHDLVINDEHHIVTLDPVFNRPVIQGKSIVPTTGQTPYQAMAKALADAPNLPKALEAGVNLPQLSEQTLRHYGGALGRAYVARMKSLRQISPKSLQMVYGQGEVEPIYYFEQDEDLVALPANLRGTDSGDLEDIWGRRGMMAMDAQEVFPETLGYVTLPGGKFVVPNVSKGMARAKIEMNSTEVRFNAMTDIAHHRDPENIPDIIRRSKLRPQSGQIDREAVIGTLIVPHMPEAQAQMRLHRDVAERLILGQNKKGSETISFDDLADLRLPGAHELGQIHRSPWMRLYERAGKTFGVEHPDTQYTAVDAVRVNLPRTSETGHMLMRESYRLRTEDDKPIHLALNQHMFALLDPESATPEEYGLAVQEANNLLAPHSMVIGGGKKRGTTYDPQIEWDYRFWNHPRHSSKVQGSIGQKATSAIHSVMGYSPNPEQEALMQAVGAILPGDEPVKMATVYMAAMANMAPQSPTLREELEKRGLTPDKDGAYTYGPDTWEKWIKAVREVVLDPIEGKNPELAQKLADEKFLHPGFVVQTVADYHTAAPFMPGGNVPGYGVDEISYQMADEKGNLPDEPTEGYLITSPPMTALYAPLPYKFLTSIPVSDRPGKMNFSDLNRLYLRDKPLFEAIRQLGEPHQRTAQSIVEAALNVPISDEDVESGRGRILRSAPPIEEDARILEEKATGVKPERAADLYYAQALKEWATNPTTGVVQDLAIQKGQLRQRLLNPDALLHVGNFGIEGHNDARIFSDQVNTIRNLENQDRSTFLYYEKRFEQSIREMAVQSAIRKALWGGPLEHAYTHNMMGSMALPVNALASGYTGREQKRYLTEGDETFDQLSAIASRQPSVTMNQTLPMQALTLQEANQRYAMGLDLDPRFTPRNLSISPAGSAAALRQADYDGDIQLVALVSSKMGVSPASEEATLRAALISSNLPKEKVDELMAAIPTADGDPLTEEARRQALIHGWQQTYQQDFAGGDAEAKGQNWISNYVPKEPGGDLLAQSVAKNVNAVAVTTNTELMRPAINEAHAKSMVGSVDSGIEGLIAVTSGLGLTNPEDWEYLHAGLGLNAKQPTIDIGGKKSLDELTRDYNWMRGGHWRHMFNREWRDSMHVDRVIDFVNAARRRGVHMEALEPLLRDAGGDINERQEGVYNLLKVHDQAGRDVRLQDLLNVMAGTQNQSYDADQAMGLLENTPLSLYGRAMEMARTSYLVDNEESVQTGSYPKSNILGLLHQEGIEQVPTWYARMVTNRNDPAKLREGGIPVGVDEARKRVWRYVREKVSENPLLNMAYDMLLGRRMASSNQTFQDLETEGPEAYPRLIRDAARYGNDLFSKEAKGRLKPIAYGARPWDRTDDLEVQYDEHKMHLAAKAREIRDAYQQGGWGAVKRVETLSNEVFSPSGLRDEGELQQMIEGFVLTGAEQTAGFHPAAREAMGEGSIWHDLHREMRIAQGANPKNLEQSMLWTGAGVAYHGRIDELDPDTKTISDLKFVSENQYEQATQKGGSYRYNEAQVASYAYGKSEMTGEDWRYGTLTYVNRDQADAAMEQLLGRKGFRPRRPRESYGDYLGAAREAKAITPSMTAAVLGHVQSTEMPPIDRNDPAVQQNLSRMIGAQMMASFISRKTGLTRAKSIGGRRGGRSVRRPQTNPIASAMRKTKAIRQAMTAAGYGKLYGRPVGLPDDGLETSHEEEFMSFNSMRKEGEEDYNLKQAGARTRRSLADELNNDPVDISATGVRGPPPAAAPDTTITPAAPTSSFDVQDAQENLAALVDAPEPESYSSQVRRFQNLAALGGIGVKEGQDVAGWASTTIDADRPIIKLGKRIDEHPRADAVRFHELGHAAIRLKYGKRENIPDSVPAILGLPDTPETREALDRQLERARVYAYGDYRQDPDKESTPSEKAADIIGLSMMDPDAIGARSVAPQLLAAANLFVSGIDPILASAAGLNAQIPAANLNNRTNAATGGQPPNPPTPPTAGVAGTTGDEGTPGPGNTGNGAQQPQGIGHPYGTMADWMSGAQTGGAMYTMRARMKDGVYQFSVDKLKEPGKEGVPSIDQLIDQMGKSGEYYAELNPWIQRLEEAMKSGVHDMKGLSTALRRSQAALKDMYSATPKPWEYNLSLSRKGQPGIAAHDKFNEEANQRLKQIKNAQHQVSFLQNRLRMVQIQEGVMDLESYGEYFRDKYDRGPRRGGGGGGGRRGGMGAEEDMSPWGVFTDQMGGFAGLGWLGWGMFGLQRVNQVMFSGIREDIEMYRGGQVGLDTMRRAEYGMPAGSPLSLTQQLTGNDFIKNYVKMKTGERFQGWSTAIDDTWNRLYSVDDQVDIHTKKEVVKGILGAGAAAFITANMLGKTTKTVRAAGTALGAMAGFRAIDSAETPQEEMDNLVTTAINLAVGGGFVVEKFGKKAAPKAVEAATQAASKYAPKGIAEAIGYYGLGRFGASTLGKGIAWLGKGVLTKALPFAGQVALGYEGALLGMGALASLVPEGDRDPALYEQYLEGSPVSRALAPWLADKTPWAAGFQRSVRGLVDYGNQNPFFGSKQPSKPSAAQERAQAVKAMQSGNLSTLPIKDHEDLMFYLGAAGAGQTPEEVARYAGRFMAMTGNTLDDLKDPTNPATKLLYTMVSQAVREQVNVKNMQDLGFGVAGEVGLLPNNPRGQRFADSYLTLPTIQQEQLALGLGFVGQWNNDRLGLSVGAQTQMGYTFATRVAPNYTTDQISRSMRLVQPSTPYEYNLSLAKGILTPQRIEAGWGIPAANIGMTMDLSTGLPANYDAMIANEDHTRGLSRGYTRWQWGLEAGEHQRKFEVSQALMDLSWQGTQMGFRHQREDMARSIGNLQASLGMQLAERALQRDMMMTQFRHTEEDMAVQLQRRPIIRAWQDEDIDRGRDRAGLEYGWKQEDYRRAMRFSTGREKIEIRRRMERDQVRYGMEEDQRGKEKERLEQGRQWEDEDFGRKKAHYEELKGKQIELFDLQTSHMIAQANMQIDNIRANLAQLEEQAALAQEVHDIRQADLLADKAAWEIQHAKMKEYTEAMWAAEDARLKLIRDQEKYTAAMNLLFVKWKDEDMPSLVQLAKDLYDWIEAARKALADLPQFPPTAADNTPPTSTPVANNNQAWVRDPVTGVVTYPNNGNLPVGTPVGPDVRPTPNVDDLPVQARPPGLVPPGGGLPSARSSMDLIEEMADLLFNSQAARTSLERQYSQDRRR